MKDYNPLEIAYPVIKALDDLSVSYYMGGSAASSQHGIARFTKDIDLCADLKNGHALPFVNQLKDEFYVDEDSIRDAIKRRSSFNVIHFKKVFKVDILCRQTSSTLKA